MSGPVVRLLTRRKGMGVNRPRPFIDPLIEVAEVFRIDVIAQAFEHEDPPFRVRYIFNKSSEWERDYPLELPDLNIPQFSPVAFWADKLFKMIYEGDFRPLYDIDFLNGANPGDFRVTWEEFGNRGAPCWGEDSAEDFFSPIGLLQANGSLGVLDQEDRDTCIAIVRWIIDHHPIWSLLWVPYFRDVVSLRFIQLWLLDENRQFDQSFLGWRQQINDD